MAFEIIYTNKGLDKLVLAESGTPLVFEKFAVGDGESPPTPEQTTLQNEKWRGSINKAAPAFTNPQRLLVECMVPADIGVTEAFYIRELGLFDVDGDLIAIAQVPESYYAPTSDGLGSEKLYNFNLSISNEAEVTLQLDSTIYATQQSVKELDEKVDTLASQFTDDLNNLNDKVDTLTDQFNTELDTVNGRIDTTNSNLEATNSKVSTLDSELDDTNDRIDSTNATVSSINSRVGSLESDVDSLQSQVGAIDAEVISLNSKVNSLDSEIETLDANIGGLNSTVIALGKEVSGMSDDITVATNKANSVETKLNVLLESQIGEIIINLNPKHKNKDSWTDGVFTYLLCNGQGVNQSKYPRLHEIYNYTPDFRDGALRSITTSSSRNLGSYQEDSVQQIKATTHTVLSSSSNDSSGAMWVTGINSDSDLFDHKKGNGQGKWGVLNFDSSKVVKTDSETRMRNVAVQFYIKANVLI